MSTKCSNSIRVAHGLTHAQTGQPKKSFQLANCQIEKAPEGATKIFYGEGVREIPKNAQIWKKAAPDRSKYNENVTKRDSQNLGKTQK